MPRNPQQPGPLGLGCTLAGRQGPSVLESRLPSVPSLSAGGWWPWACSVSMSPGGGSGAGVGGRGGVPRALHAGRGRLGGVVQAVQHLPPGARKRGRSPETRRRWGGSPESRREGASAGWWSHGPPRGLLVPELGSTPPRAQQALGILSGNPRPVPRLRICPREKRGSLDTALQRRGGWGKSGGVQP